MVTTSKAVNCKWIAAICYRCSASTVYVPDVLDDNVTVAVPSVAPKHDTGVEPAVPVSAAGVPTVAAIELDTQPAADVATTV